MSIRVWGTSHRLGGVSRHTPGSVRPAHQAVAAHGPLSTHEAQRFRAQGFLVLPLQCEREELRSTYSILAKLFQAQVGYDEGNQFDMLGTDVGDGRQPIQPQILGPSLYAAALLRTAHYRRMQAVARQLLGVDAQFAFDHSILKRARTGPATPWHQDEAHQQDPRFHVDQISFWLPLQDTDECNGCMRYVPGSNRGPLLPHRAYGGDARVHALECPPECFDETQALTVPVAAGTCIVHDSRTLHMALANRSEADRLVYVLSFRGTPVPRSQGLPITDREPQQTARMERSRRWRRRGGFVLQFLRWMKRGLRLDWRSLWPRLRRAR